MIFDPIKQPDEFRQELKVLSAYIASQAQLARQGMADREALSKRYSGALAFLGKDFAPSVGINLHDVFKPLMSIVRGISELVCESHIKALGELPIPFEFREFLKDKLSDWHDFSADRANGKSVEEVIFDYFQNFCIETVFYNELAETLTLKSSLEMAYRKAANGLLDELPWFRFESKPRGIVFSKQSFSEKQYSNSPRSLRVDYSVESEFQALAQHLKSFADFSGNSDLLMATQLMVSRFRNLDRGFDLRESVEYCSAQYMFFKSKIELRIPYELFSQLVAFCRIYGSEHLVERRLTPNLIKAAA